MTPQIKAQIDAMSREEMARVWRFAPVGSPLFAKESGDYFKKRFDSLGGLNSMISKAIGWDKQ